MGELLDLLPRPLYEEVVRGRWLPLVGAGLSRNALVLSGEPPLDWNGLADRLRPDLSDADDGSDAVDAISAYAHEHGRTALVERVCQTIRVADAQPAPVHLALCRLPTDYLITTNFDFLLERAFEKVGRTCHPVADEHQLAINNPYTGPVLYKMHGDMHRPDRLVLTEEDFDQYLLRNPFFATVLASLIAQRSTVLIGYSLADPDLRQILTLIRERLGRNRRPIYALEVSPAASKVARFARRDVKMVALPGDRRNPAPTLRRLFDEIFEALPNEARERLIPRSHDSAIAIRTGRAGPTCFLSAPLAAQADYAEWIGPAAARRGISIVRLEDFTAPGESIFASVDGLIGSVGCAIVDLSSQWTRVELGMVLNRLPPEKILAVVGTESDFQSAPPDLVHLQRPETTEDWTQFSDQVVEWLVKVLGLDVATPNRGQLELIGAVMTSAADFEGAVGDRLGVPPRYRSISRLTEEAWRSNLLSDRDRNILRNFVAIRNGLAHGRTEEMAYPQEIWSVVGSVKELTDRFRSQHPPLSDDNDVSDS